MSNTRRLHKAGVGWTSLAINVFERSGFRLHTGGQLFDCRSANKKEWRCIANSSDYFGKSKITAWTAINKMTGGNRKRGLMVWANQYIDRAIA